MPVFNAPIGTRVVISEESENYDYYISTQSQYEEGTITQLYPESGWKYEVRWDCGEAYIYRVTDLKEVNSKPKEKTSGFKKFQKKLK